MGQLEQMVSLHKYVEIHYVVDGYCIQICDDSGDVLKEASAPTLAEAIKLMVDHA